MTNRLIETVVQPRIKGCSLTNKRRKGCNTCLDVSVLANLRQQKKEAAEINSTATFICPALGGMLATGWILASSGTNNLGAALATVGASVGCLIRYRPRSLFLHLCRRLPRRPPARGPTRFTHGQIRKFAVAVAFCRVRLSC
jgi:hypothetical protein